MIIKNITIHTMNSVNTIIPNGFVRIENDKIAEVGVDNNFSDTEIFDGKGLSVYPGFVDAHTHLGIFEDGITFEGDDANESTEPITPQLRALDAVNPMDRCFSEAIAAGITTVLTSPGSANPIAGQILAMKTYGRRVDDMLVAAPAAIKFALGENPKSVYNDKDQMPVTRMATAALIRETLTKAQKYREDKKKAETHSDEFDVPEFDAKSEALLPLLEGKIPAHFHAHRADDIFTAIRIAKEFQIPYVIVHGTEGHLICEELKAEDASVLSGPFLTDRSKPELKNLTTQSPGLMAHAGIRTAIITDHPETPIQYLPICAAVAVREGMDKTAALRAITSVPAQICGIDDRVGSIEVGKDADLLIFEGDPLNIMNKPKAVFVSGRLVLNRMS